MIKISSNIKMKITIQKEIISKHKLNLYLMTKLQKNNNNKKFFSKIFTTTKSTKSTKKTKKT